MAHAEVNLSAVKSVLVVHDSSSDTDCVTRYMESETNNEGRAVQHASKMDYFTHVVDFSNHADAVNVVRKDRHSIAGRPAFVFLYDKDSKTVYSGHQTISFQGENEDIPIVHPGEPTTVIVTPILGHPDVTADEIRGGMEKLECRVQCVCPQKPVCIAIVKFEYSDDAKRAVDVGEVMIKDQVHKPVEQYLAGSGNVPLELYIQALRVRVFLLLPLP